MNCLRCNKELGNEDLSCSGCGEKTLAHSKDNLEPVDMIDEISDVNNENRSMRVELDERRKETILGLKNATITTLILMGVLAIPLAIAYEKNNGFGSITSITQPVTEMKVSEELEKEREQRKKEEEEIQEKSEEQIILENEEKFNSLVNKAHNASLNNDFSGAVDAMSEAMKMDYRYLEALNLKVKYLELKTQQEKAIKKTQGVTLGMTKQDVLDSSWGKPKDINRTITEYAIFEQWVYDGYQYLYFEDGILKSIQN